MPPTPLPVDQTIVIGAGLAGLTVTLNLLSQGHRVRLLDRGDATQLGGLARHAFGGMTRI